MLSAAEFANVVIYSIDISKTMAQSIEAPPPANRSVLDNRPPGAVYHAGRKRRNAHHPIANQLGNWVPLLKDIYDSAKGTDRFRTH